MTWTIYMNGHVDDPDKEAEVMERARQLVSELAKDEYGCTAASFTGMHSGAHSLMPNVEPGD